MGDSGSTLCLIIVIPTSICFKAFRYVLICQRNTGFYPKYMYLFRWRSQRLETHLRWNSCILKNVWIFDTIFYSFYGASSIHFTGRKNCWLNAAMCDRVVQHGVPNVTETFLFDVSIVIRLWLIWCFIVSSPEPNAHWVGLRRPSSTLFKHLLRNHWADWSQISFGVSMGWDNESLFKWSWSHDQDGRHSHIW